uniref:Large ribosomal subunit protein uL14 n=2 Tax=Sus scrofa TaxID=9823 RepID=A0A8D1UC07_PIG
FTPYSYSSNPNLPHPTHRIQRGSLNTETKNLYNISVKGIKGQLHRLPAAGVGDMAMATVEKGKPELRRKVHPAVEISQPKAYQRKMTFIFFFLSFFFFFLSFILKITLGFAITGPVAKECADLHLRITPNVGGIA